MTRRRKVSVDTSAIRPRVDTFDRLQKGDEVKLTGERGTFVFMSAALDPDGDVVWIDLFGGLPGRGNLRTVRPERLKIPSERALQRHRRQRALDGASR